MAEDRTSAGNSLCLPQAARLKQKRDFNRLKTQGRRLVCGCLILNWASTGESDRPRLGVVTSRKVGSAVERSRARRLLREAWRRKQNELMPPLDIVLVARASIVGKKLAHVEHDFHQALHRARIVRQNEAG